jgi:hypothetical protein
MTSYARCLLLVAASILLVPCVPLHALATAAEADTQSACQTLPPASSPDFETRLEKFMVAYCYRSQGWMHDANVRSSGGVHS